MKLTYPICFSIDVHKTFLVATIIRTDVLVPKYAKKRFSTFSRDLLARRQWSYERTSTVRPRKSVKVYNASPSDVPPQVGRRKSAAKRIKSKILFIVYSAKSGVERYRSPVSGKRITIVLPSFSVRLASSIAA